MSNLKVEQIGKTPRHYETLYLSFPTPHVCSWKPNLFEEFKHYIVAFRFCGFNSSELPIHRAPQKLIPRFTCLFSKAHCPFRSNPFDNSTAQFHWPG
jgi:hypothetical protein